MIGEAKISGNLGIQVKRAQRAPMSWRVRNALRWSFLWGFLVNWLAYWFSKITGVPTITAQLEARLIHADGKVINFGVISRRVVTTVGVDFLGDDWFNDGSDITNMNYHACGTGTGAEAVGDTALTESTTITDRATGTKSQPANGQVRSIATQAFTGSGAITEHGLFSVVTESSGVLWDRSQFAAINVANGDSIQWTYTATINSGG